MSVNTEATSPLPEGKRQLAVAEALVHLPGSQGERFAKVFEHRVDDERRAHLFNER